MSIENRLRNVREKRGIAAADLARRTGISRQTIYAIEAGSYVPNTAVALQLARQLEVRVEDLFSISGASEPPSLGASVLSAGPVAAGRPVLLSRVGQNWVGVPVSLSAYFLPDSDGIITRSHRGTAGAEIRLFGTDEALRGRLVVAGCDPAMSLLARLVEKASGADVLPVPAASRLALEWLKQRKVHIAGTHLEDAETGEFNLPYLRRNFPGEDLAVVTFANWEEGLVVRTGNPKKILGVTDLARPRVRFVNREPGSGSRNLLDRLLADAGLEQAAVWGYGDIVFGHLAAASAVSLGKADCCLATAAAARAFGLHFVPIRRERFDLVLRRELLDVPAVRRMMDVLQNAALRRKLELLAGYDTSHTGSVIGP